MIEIPSVHSGSALMPFRTMKFIVKTLPLLLIFATSVDNHFWWIFAKKNIISRYIYIENFYAKNPLLVRL